jgi:hypothetical protein
MDHAPKNRRRLILGSWALAYALSSLSCAALSERGATLVPTRYQVRTGPFILFSNFPMSEDTPAVRCLQALERDLVQHLDYQSSAEGAPVEVYVLDDRNAFTHFLRYYHPELPPRRAFFLAQGPQRVVYTYLSPRLEEDLRHEATHALLNGSYGSLPLWLDEGLAEYFENDLAQPGAERERIEHITGDLAGGWSPNLARLESLSDIHEMTPRDYREAWAWIHLCLNGPEPGKSRLLHALAGASDKPGKPKLSETGMTKEQLLSHLKSSPQNAQRVPPVPDEPSVRLQDKTVETTRPSAEPPGFWRRLRAWIGL